MLINGNMVLGSTILYRARNIATITYDLTNCTSSNETATVRANSSYTTTLIASTNFTYCGAQVLMGGQDVTLDCYDISTGTITIQHVTGNIVIKAEALYGFNNASWFAIKNVAQNNFGSTIGWNIGDTKSIIIGQQTYTVRIADMTQGRYTYYNVPTRSTNMVFECVELYATSYPRDSSTNNGNYNNNTLKTTYLETILPNFPSDLQSLLDVIIIKNTYSTNVSSYAYSTSNVKIFLPSGNEVGITYGGNTDLAYSYYTEYGITGRIKKKINSSSASMWWLRDGGWNNGYYDKTQIGTVINVDGSMISTSYTDSVGSSPYNTAKSLAVPLFWAF